jgi:hypothetical protein
MYGISLHSVIVCVTMQLLNQVRVTALLFKFQNCVQKMDLSKITGGLGTKSLLREE